MPEAEIRVGVLLCPDKQLEGESPHSSWPCPAGLKVTFQKKGTPPADAGEAVTGPNGLATSPELEHGVYTVRVDPGAKLVSWTPVPAAFDVDTRKTKKRHSVKLVPPAGRRLLPLLLCHEGQDGKPIPLGNAEILIKVPGGAPAPFHSHGDGHAYALVPHGKPTVEVEFKTVPGRQKNFEPPDKTVTFRAPEPTESVVEIPQFVYSVTARRAPVRGITIIPTIEVRPGHAPPLTGATVVAELHATSSQAVRHTRTLGSAETEVHFPNLDPGVYKVTVSPPASFNGWPIKAGQKSVEPHYLHSGEHFQQDVKFDFQTEKINGYVQAPQGKALDQELRLEIYGPDGSIAVTAGAGPFTAEVPSSAPLKVRLAPGPAPTVGEMPLQMSPPEQDVAPPPNVTTVVLEYKHAITGQAVDEHGDPMPGAVVALFDGKDVVASAVAGDHGYFIAGVKGAGDYFVAVQTEGGEPLTRRPVRVQSTADVGKVAARSRGAVGASGGRAGPDGARSDRASDSLAREAFTDLAAYPVLTEEITTGGTVPAPRDSGPGPGYGQTVDQVIRDVLGWRPGGDVTGFQAALAGAFQLREVEGHTEWSWQQRGYAVQADMGGLTGAQASIYARAKSALDQVQPLLTGLTPLDPALYPPQDLEAIRTVVTAELAELVTELSFEGGPRIQRVDELFGLLTGDTTAVVNPNPDQVQGQLGILRQRFGLTPDKVTTLDEERVVTNFRIVVEQVLALQSSWQTDRGLLSGVGAQTSLGTILILLSRSLEAVGDSVDELNFTLDSVFIDAAQRQVVELRFAGVPVNVPRLPLNGAKSPETFAPDEPPLLLSDLLDWVIRASRDEGPRLIQDAGKDGVLAFAPVLERLRLLIHATGKLAGHGGALPAGMRTPRVERALSVLAGQLDEAANLARLVRRDGAPEISAVWLIGSPDKPLVPLAKTPTTHLIWVAMVGSNFRGPASAVLTAEGRADLPAISAATGPYVPTPSLAYAQFANPFLVSNNAGTTWVVSLTNNDATQSNQIEVLQVPL